MGQREGDNAPAPRIDWKEPLEPFLVHNEEALLCIELRNKLTSSSGAPPAGGKLSSLQFERVGAVRRRIAF